MATTQKKDQPQEAKQPEPEVGDIVYYWHGPDENCDRPCYAAIVSEYEPMALGLSVIFPGHHNFVPREAIRHQGAAKKGEACWTFRGEPRLA